MAQAQTVKDAAMMDAHTLAGAAHGSTSRLLIHACADEDHGAWTMPALLRRALARVRGVPREGPALSTLEIRDLPGHRLLTLTNAEALIDVVLPTGTYHVTTQSGENRRHYTVVLEQDATTELHLLPARSHRH